jgi:hypothetical protein
VGSTDWNEPDLDRRVSPPYDEVVGDEGRFTDSIVLSLIAEGGDRVCVCDTGDNESYCFLSVIVHCKATRLLTDVSTVIAGVSSLCPAIVKWLPDFRMGATDEIRCRKGEREVLRVRSDKGLRQQRAWQRPLRMTQRKSRLWHRKQESRKWAHRGGAQSLIPAKGDIRLEVWDRRGAEAM